MTALPESALDSIKALLESSISESPRFPPTIIFNEGWLLRLVLNWFSSSRAPGHELTFQEGSIWFSEALLLSAFFARKRGDKAAESRTHADGVIGHIAVGKTGKADLSLLAGAKQFLVVEAKLYSKLSSNVTNAKYLNQAARTVACIVEVLKRAGHRSDGDAHLGFYVLAPHNQIERGMFTKEMELESIHNKVKRRVEQFGGGRDEWYREWFLPFYKQIKVAVWSWKDIIATIGSTDQEFADSLAHFYALCLRYNR